MSAEVRVVNHAEVIAQQNPDNIIYPSKLAYAHFAFSIDELKILFYLLDSFQERYRNKIKIKKKNKEEEITEMIEPVQQDLFGAVHYPDVKISALGGKYTRVRDAFFSMREKTVRVDNKTTEALVGMIEMPELNKKNGTVSFWLNKHFVPIFETFNHHGNLDRSITSKLTPQSIKIFMLFNLYRDNGFFKMSAEEFRKILMLENKYNKFSVFKARVIDKAIEEIRVLFDIGQSSLKVEYDLESSKKRSDDDWDRTLTFKIVSYHNKNRIEATKEAELERQNNLNYVVYTLRKIYENSEAYFNAILEHLSVITAEDMFNLKIRLEKMRTEYVQNQKLIENDVDAQKIVSKILKEDYGYRKREIQNINAYVAKAKKVKG